VNHLFMVFCPLKDQDERGAGVNRRADVQLGAQSLAPLHGDANRRKPKTQQENPIRQETLA